MNVAVVVLTWNGCEDTVHCLRSMRAVSYPHVKTIVVDNASTDDTVDTIRAGFPEVDLVLNSANLGFAAGVNRGISRAMQRGADAVLLLNNDTEVDAGFIDALVDEARSRPAAAALCSKVLFADPRDRVWFFGAAYDPLRGYQGRQVGYGCPDGPRFAQVTLTDRLCGASVLIPRWALDEVGLFDEGLFMYSEDVDWSLRARASGGELLVVPRSRVWHKVSAAAGGEASALSLYYATRNAIRVAERHAPLGAFGTWRRRLTLLAAGLAQPLLAGPRKAERVQAVLRGFRAGIAGVEGPEPVYSPDAART